VNAGDIITVGTLLFEVQTKESSALNSTKNDSLYSFKGIIKVLAKKQWAVSQADKQAGDYVQEGDDVVEIANKAVWYFCLMCLLNSVIISNLEATATLNSLIIK